MSSFFSFGDMELKLSQMIGKLLLYHFPNFQLHISKNKKTAHFDFGAKVQKKMFFSCYVFIDENICKNMSKYIYSATTSSLLVFFQRRTYISHVCPVTVNKKHPGGWKIKNKKV